jgi:hypothetical protein
VGGVSTLEMRYGRALLAGAGWAGVLGGLALCTLIFLSAYLAFHGEPQRVKPRDGGVVKLPSVPDAKIPRVPLAPAVSRPRARGAGGGASGRSGGATAPAGRAPQPAGTPRTTAPVRTPVATTPPPRLNPTPAPPAAAATPAASGGGTAPAPTLGDTTRQVVGAVGTEVGSVSPPVGQVVDRTGDTLGNAVDTLLPPRR